MHHSARVLLAALTLALLLPGSALASVDYPPPVKELIEQRCMVCHGCYDAPCQLKLDAWRGLERGANKDQVYDGTRLRTGKLTRLFEDAHSIEEWRKKDFYPVLNPEEPDAGVMARMLALKQQHPLPEGELLPDSFDLRLNRDQQCPKEAEFDDYAEDYPLWGMPYALPGLTSEQHAVLDEWLQRGAPGIAQPAPAPVVQDTLARWEAFLNGDSHKQQLMSRYIFEHLFIASLYLEDLPEAGGYYQLVRSRTPPGEPLDIIATRRPYDAPDVKRVYYRLMPQRTAVLAKRHMPYALHAKRMQRWQALFLEPEYEVSELPSYADKVASNPFVAFRELPLNARYKFMLDEAQFTIMAYIKGPVCRGQVALNVIDDHFWVVFLDPDTSRGQHTAEFLASESGNLRLPSAVGGSLISLVEWNHYAKNQLQFLEAKLKFIERQTADPDTSVNLQRIWDGDGDNDNAALTIFRHNDSASVVKGLVGRQPKTAWVIDYSLLERIHYLLVAGFDVYGTAVHQLETRLYMDFLRMEGEQNFLFFLPQQERIALRDHWYRGAEEHVKKYVVNDSLAFDRDSDIRYRTDEPKAELFDMLKEHVFGAKAPRYQPVDARFDPLLKLTGLAVAQLPEVAFLQVLARDGSKDYYTLVHNNGYSNNAQLFHEEERRIEEEDYLTLVNGFIGAYPNVFFQLPESDISGFVKAVAAMRDADDYTSLVSRYGVRRTAPWIWRVSDDMSAHYRKTFPREAGLFDLNRYENR
tara:strand:- start:1750 stop:4002 length:2253 start_codon:yes stop_codon:yes gene_type:complete